MKVLLSKCKCSGTSTMLIKYLDHFYNIEGLNQLSKIYTKQDTKIKYFNINCFWGLMIGELVDSKLVDGKLVDGKLVINVELF